MVRFEKAGKLEKTYKALRIVIDDQTGGRGDLIIGARAVRDLPTGRMVELNRVQMRDGEVVIALAGTARVSTTGRALMIYTGGDRYTVPMAQVRAVVAGTRTAALVSRMVDEPVIDADEAQAQAQAQQGGRRIDEGLAKTFA